MGDVFTGQDNEKLAEILQMLLAAGYFRARIPALPTFDKILGGLAWSISASNVEVNVDVVFADSFTIGQKIKLGEVVCKALQMMKCPYPLAPHQIRGNDFDSIFPVVQWLVKTVYETRAENEAFIRRCSETHFTNALEAVTIEGDDAPSEETQSVVRQALEVAKPQRRYRRRNDISTDLVEARVESTLAEFGVITQKTAPTQAKKPKQAGKADPLAGQKEEEARAREEQRIAALMSGMTEVEGENVNMSTVAGLVSSQSDQIASMVSEYEERAGERAGVMTQRGSEEAHKRDVATLQKQIAQLEQRVRVLQAAYEKENGEVEEQRQRVSELNENCERLQGEIEQMDAAETPENALGLAQLRALIAMNERLRKQEGDFKASCKQQVMEINEKIASLTASQDERDAAERKKAEAALAADLERLQAIRQLLARKTREAASLQRKIDDIPTRTELIQYERRFVELYDQISARADETKNYYDTFNTLQDTHRYLSKEVSLLNSVHDGFPKAVVSKTGPPKMVEQLEGIIDGVKQTLAKAEARLAEEKQQRDTINKKYTELVEKQRLYFKAVKELSEEAKKSDQIQQHLAQAGQ